MESKNLMCRLLKCREVIIGCSRRLCISIVTRRTYDNDRKVSPEV
jgi:hypothetical protein